MALSGGGPASKNLWQKKANQTGGMSPGHKQNPWSAGDFTNVWKSDYAQGLSNPYEGFAKALGGDRNNMFGLAKNAINTATSAMKSGADGFGAWGTSIADLTSPWAQRQRGAMYGDITANTADAARAAAMGGAGRGLQGVAGGVDPIAQQMRGVTRNAADAVSSRGLGILDAGRGLAGQIGQGLSAMAGLGGDLARVGANMWNTDLAGRQAADAREMDLFRMQHADWQRQNARVPAQEIMQHRQMMQQQQLMEQQQRQMEASRQKYNQGLAKMSSPWGSPQSPRDQMEMAEGMNQMGMPPLWIRPRR